MLSKQREQEFEAVTVDRQGSIGARHTGRTQVYLEEMGGGVSLAMVAIPGQMFWMGSPAGEGYDDERPRHVVTVAPFLMGRYPVTQAEWQIVMGTTPSRFKGARLPVENVSWNEAREFCARLSKKAGRVYRLPSEAQWEFACRAGSTSPFHTGETITSDLANYCGEHTYLVEPKGVYRHVATEVGHFPPNAFGLYDMHGNVWEWCADPWHDNYQGAPADGRVWESGGALSYRVARGGSWHDVPDVCRAAVRLKFNPAERDDLIGFRVSAEAPA